MQKLSLLAILLLAALPALAGEPPLKRYDHIFVIIEENHSFDEIIGNKAAPNLNRFAQIYGLATNFFGEVHPSEGNYVAMVGGDSYGIHNDDAFWCLKGAQDPACPNAGVSDYADHTIDGPNLAQQLEAHGLSWKGYFADIPEAGSKLMRSALDKEAGKAKGLYASKHNGFLNFRSVQDDPALAIKVVGWDQLARDIASDHLPNFAHIVPNNCDDMHGLAEAEAVPEDCHGTTQEKLIARGDATIAKLVGMIMKSKAWRGKGNVAIVVTFDEGGETNATNHAEGCCGADAGNPNNFGGGWVPTVVITNHGPRHVVDPTPYNHYSLLRTTEAAFGITDYIGHAADADQGVTVMRKLFER
jgi:phospholipase C